MDAGPFQGSGEFVGQHGSGLCVVAPKMLERCQRRERDIQQLLLNIAG